MGSRERMNCRALVLSAVILVGVVYSAESIIWANYYSAPVPAEATCMWPPELAKKFGYEACERQPPPIIVTYPDADVDVDHEMARVDDSGRVFIDWSVVDKAGTKPAKGNTNEAELIARILLAVRDHTWSPMK